MSPKLYRSIFILLFVFGGIGCQKQLDEHDDDQEYQPILSNAIEAQANTEDSLNFDGRSWALAGPCRSTGDIFRPSMSAVYYTTNDPSLRLVELFVDESIPIKEGVYSRIISVQIDQNGRWISHGLRADWDLDGGRGEGHYLNGQPHGTQRHWYPNGQLHIEQEWANGKMHGRSRGWYSNGKAQYESQYVNGEEVSGQFWDENGQLR